jgi:hypothetical protein
MTRQAEHVRDRTDVTSPRSAAAGWWSRHRSGWKTVARGVVPRVLIAGVLVAAALGIGQVGLDGVLRVAGAVALLVIAGGAAAVGALALVLRRRLAELRHLPDLGRPFVTNHEDGLVTSVLRDSAGNLVLEVASEARQTIVMDEGGAPDHMSAAGATIVQLPVPGSSNSEPEVLHVLENLVSQRVPVRLISEGVIALTGPVLVKWRLEAEDGVVVTGRA